MLIESFYPILRPILFQMEPELAHQVLLESLKKLSHLGLGALWTHPQTQAKTVMGLQFCNPVGLAAGVDKNGTYLDALSALGFGFIEIGTVTPRPQSGNPKPRLFRLPQIDALINRLGFNNEGVQALMANVHQSRFFQEKKGILGINIGKNMDTPLNRAAEDYLYCFEKIYPYASYVTINVSSPNTKNLRQLQTTEALDDLLTQLKTEQYRLADLYKRYVPLVVKIAPDLDNAHVGILAAILVRHGIDGVIATNTTIQREQVNHLKYGHEAGGLSGRPLAPLANRIVHLLKKELGDALPIIGVGGIMSGQDAVEKITAGAQLVQIYTGLIYRGPKLIRACAKAIAKEVK